MAQEQPGGWKIGYTVDEASQAAKKGKKIGENGGFSDKTKGQLKKTGGQVDGVIKKEKK